MITFLFAPAYGGCADTHRRDRDGGCRDVPRIVGVKEGDGPLARELLVCHNGLPGENK